MGMFQRLRDRMNISDRITIFVILCISLPVFGFVGYYGISFRGQVKEEQIATQRLFLESANAAITDKCRQTAKSVDYLYGVDAVNNLIQAGFQRNSRDILAIQYDVRDAFMTVEGVNLGLFDRITYYSCDPSIPEHGNRLHNISWAQKDAQIRDFLASEKTSAFLFDVSEKIYLEIPETENTCMLYVQKIMDIKGKLYGIFAVRMEEENLFGMLSLAEESFPIELRDSPGENGVSVYNEALERYLYQEVDLNAIREASRKTIGITLLLAGVAMVVLVAAVRYFISRIFRNMHQMMEAMEGAAQGNFEKYIPENGSADIRQISVQFNLLLRQLNDYVEQKLLLEDKNRRMEAAALQLQMNPHFFYNGLGMLQCVMEDWERYEYADAVSFLSAILRYNMSNRRKSSVGEELACVKNYMSFVNTFRTRKISFEIEVEEKLQELEIPRFLLQPLAENAVKYGDGEWIRITGSLEKGQLQLKVQNSGEKISKERLREIQNSLLYSSVEEEEGKQKSSIGLRNIAGRLRLTYQDHFMIQILSEEYTEISLILPVS